MSTTTTLADAMRAADIAVRITSGPVHHRGERWEHNVWRFELAVAGETILGNAPYRTGMALPRPTGEDVFGSVLADIQSVDGYDDWLDWAEGLGYTKAAELRRARDDFAEIAARRSLLVERIGVDALTEMLELAE